MVLYLPSRFGWSVGLVFVIALCLSWRFSWWFLLAFVVVLALERIMAAREKTMWMFLAAVHLSLEMLANDFAGWGMARRSDRQRALELLGGSPRTEWLDLYLPRRSEIDSTVLKAFGPEQQLDT